MYNVAEVFVNKESLPWTVPVNIFSKITMFWSYEGCMMSTFQNMYGDIGPQLLHVVPVPASWVGWLAPVHP